MARLVHRTIGLTKTEHLHDVVIELFVNKEGPSAGQMRALSQITETGKLRLASYGFFETQFLYSPQDGKVATEPTGEPHHASGCLCAGA
jgi:hypothetical protein